MIPHVLWHSNRGHGAKRIARLAIPIVSENVRSDLVGVSRSNGFVETNQVRFPFGIPLLPLCYHRGFVSLDEGVTPFRSIVIDNHEIGFQNSGDCRFLNLLSRI